MKMRLRRLVLAGFGAVIITTLSACKPSRPAEPISSASPDVPAGMALIPAGSFMMGDPSGMPDARPPHDVSLSSFYVDTHEVTQRAYEEVMGENPARWKDPDSPVEQVRWSDAVRYCNARSIKEGLQPAYDLDTWECDFSASGYRLPTEAEWEYAARAGSLTPFFYGNDPSGSDMYCWSQANAGSRTRPTGRKLPNAWGLYDVYGNVWEWCHDMYAPDYYQSSPSKNPTGPLQGEQRVLRGGSWDTDPRQCSSTYRYHEDPGYADVCFGYDVYGFRCVRNAPQ